MTLYLVRHAEAVEQKVGGRRPLSEKGRADARKLGDYLGRLGLAVEAVWHSPKLRAEQTAAALRGKVVVKKGFVERDGLLPFDSTKAIAEEIEHLGGDLMIVGHEPFLGELVTRLVAGKDAGEVVDFAKGAIACLERSRGGGWRLAWMVRPEILPE